VLLTRARRTSTVVVRPLSSRSNVQRTAGRKKAGSVLAYGRGIETDPLVRAIKRLTAIACLTIQSRAGSDERRHVGYRVVNDIAVAVPLRMHCLVEVATPFRVDRDELDVSSVHIRTIERCVHNPTRFGPDFAAEPRRQMHLFADPLKSSNELFRGGRELDAPRSQQSASPVI
jgi:hypothetical protein